MISATLIFLNLIGLCGYVWFNVLVLSSPKVEYNDIRTTIYFSCKSNKTQLLNIGWLFVNMIIWRPWIVSISMLLPSHWKSLHLPLLISYQHGECAAQEKESPYRNIHMRVQKWFVVLYLFQRSEKISFHPGGKLLGIFKNVLFPG